MRQLIVTCLLAAAGTLPASAQTPGHAVQSALESLTGGFGGCGGIDAVRDTVIPQFPGVRFIRGTCVLEHGDSTSAIVALDGDSVLYLLASRDAFNFLVDRHPPPLLDSVTVTGYARLALELAGLADAYTHIVRTWAELPTAVRALRTQSDEQPVMINHQPGSSTWQVTAWASGPCYEGNYFEVFHVDLNRGRLVFAKQTVLQACQEEP